MKKIGPSLVWNNCNICRQCILKEKKNSIANQTEMSVTKTIYGTIIFWWYSKNGLKHEENWLKSKRFIFFLNKIETSSGKGENTRPHFFMWLHREIIEMDWNMKKIDKVQTFQLFWNKIETSLLWKRWKYQALFLVFLMLC